MSQPAIFIGIDAGATKTAAVAAMADGQAIARYRTGPSAIVGLPDKRCIQTLRDSLAHVRSEQPIAHLVIGLSGVDFVDEFADQHHLLASGLGVPAAQLTLLNDSIVALVGATTAGRATLVQHGTEPTMAYRGAIGDERVFDSMGVADCFDLRHRVVPLVARMIDGRAEPTPLLDAVLEHCGVPAAGFAEWILRDAGARARIMRVAPVVFDRWRSGDAAAASLVDRAVDDYVTATVAMAQRIGSGAFDACFAGGVITQGGADLIAAIGRQLAARCDAGRVTVPAAAAEDGALSIALRTLAPVSA